MVRNVTKGSDMKFSMASVFGGSFAMLRKGFVPLLLVTLVVYLGPNLLVSFAMQHLLGITLGMPAAWQGQFLPVGIGVSLFLYFLMFVHASVVTEIAVLTSSDKAVRIGEVLRHGAGNALPIFVIYLLCGLGWALGWILIIFPAFIFGTAFSVVIPAYVTEKPGIFAAFTRSRQLTKGHRWGIFGMWFLILFATYVVSGTLEAPVVWPIIQRGMQAASNGVVAASPTFSFAATVLLTVVGSVVWVVLLVFNAGFYAALRSDKEQFSGQRVEKVFE